MNSPKSVGRGALTRRVANSTAKPKHVYRIAWTDLSIHLCWLLIDLLNYYRKVANDKLAFSLSEHLKIGVHCT